VEKTKEMRISRKPYKIQSMVDQNNPRMWNIPNIWVAW
jgi:hypothetical protein